jgi:hypothetical protein
VSLAIEYAVSLLDSSFGNDLLRRIHTQAGDFRQPLDRLRMLAEQSRHLLVQLADLA